MHCRYILGNALTAQYFSYSNDMKDLHKALNAYLKSESNGGQINPDLYYNRGMILQYLLDYLGALVAYHTSFSIDKAFVDSQKLFNGIVIF